MSNEVGGVAARCQTDYQVHTVGTELQKVLSSQCAGTAISEQLLDAVRISTVMACVETC